MKRWKYLMAAGTLLAGGLVAGSAGPAVAEPATGVAYSAGSTATRYVGWAFDTCTAPTVAQMTAWKASPYKAVGIYIGGGNRGCQQPQLTASWVSSVTRMGWRLIPIYMGWQAPCTFSSKPFKMSSSPTTAGTQATGAAADAVAKAKALGIIGGSAIYGDMEHYDVNDTTCRAAVLRYLSSWTKELHRQGYLSAVYAHQNSGAVHLSEIYNSTSYARPDALWIARWDKNTGLFNWPTVPNSYWAVGQRAKQYWGDHAETYGSVTLTIDSDRFDAPVASVGFGYTVTGNVYSRTGPAFSYPASTGYPAGSTVRILCQTYGQQVGTTTVWNKLTTGAYVTDYYVNTPSNTTYSAPIPGCSNAYQTTTSSLSRRSGPGTSYSVLGTMPAGSLAWVTCQRSGSAAGTTSVWDRLTDGSYVTDYYVATPSKTTYSAPIRRC
ncbi:glycoside hydrolase domain-containing protein [Kribbella amoyensis]|uniref:glycoside hydrolase domain-containing protein n=1 Tax=Kribbella amoyensis TaxID=996641 RepID=UPI00119D975C|nr:glycoside hydrolase domain-containing protein [Kribbella amoyensis]